MSSGQHDPRRTTARISRGAMSVVNHDNVDEAMVGGDAIRTYPSFRGRASDTSMPANFARNV